MEINITSFFNNARHADYSASVAEIGDNAGTITWRNALEDSPKWNLLDTEEKRDAFREYVKGFGAWSDDEIAGWSNVELNALFVQFVAGDVREGFERDADNLWENYYTLCEEGRVSGNLFRDDNGQIYYYLTT
jgi:hypothetical protein